MIYNVFDSLSVSISLLPVNPLRRRLVCVPVAIEHGISQCQFPDIIEALIAAASHRFKVIRQCQRDQAGTIRDYLESMGVDIAIILVRKCILGGHFLIDYSILGVLFDTLEVLQAFCQPRTAPGLTPGGTRTEKYPRVYAQIPRGKIACSNRISMFGIK
jgi:hypothetical protein